MEGASADGRNIRHRSWLRVRDWVQERPERGRVQDPNDLLLLREAEYFFTPRVAELYRLEGLMPMVEQGLRAEPRRHVLRPQRARPGAAHPERGGRGAGRLPPHRRRRRPRSPSASGGLSLNIASAASGPGYGDGGGGWQKLAVNDAVRLPGRPGHGPRRRPGPSCRRAADRVTAVAEGGSSGPGCSASASAEEGRRRCTAPATPHSGAPAAVKVFHRSVWSDPAFRVRFRRECDALSALTTPTSCRSSTPARTTAAATW